MAVQIFLRMDGVEGAVRASAHKGWCEILSWNWSLARGQAESGGKAVTVTRGHEIVISKIAGVESTQLMQLCATGAVTSSAQISTIPEVSKRETPQRYVLLSMGDVIVRSVNAAAEVDDNLVREKVILRFHKIEFGYFAPANANSGHVQSDIADHTFAWDHASKPA